MKGKVIHHIKKKIPYRKMTCGIEAVEKKLQWSSRSSVYLKSWCAMQAGLWHDKYFFDFHEMLATDLELRCLILSINYKRIKYGWSLGELEELAGSRSGKRYSNNPSFCVLVASLFHEIGIFEKTLEFLTRALALNPSSIDGYLGLSSFALDHNLILSAIPQKDTEKLQRFYSKVQTFSTFFKNELSGKKIAVVGNANSGRGRSDGNFIDAHDHVFRFNNFPSERLYEKDYGKKTTVWVRTPSIHEVPMRTDIWPETIIISSPLMLHTKNGNWKWMMEYCDRDEKLVLFDASVFRDLVQRLNAPPSAGLLAAFNISKLSHDLSHIHFLGFDFNTGKQSHYFDNQKPASRHNWGTEKVVFSNITER